MGGVPRIFKRRRSGDVKRIISIILPRRLYLEERKIVTLQVEL